MRLQKTDLNDQAIHYMISTYSNLVRTEASKSWLGINFAKDELEIIKQYL